MAYLMNSNSSLYQHVACACNLKLAVPEAKGHSNGVSASTCARVGSLVAGSIVINLLVKLPSVLWVVRLDTD